MKNDFFLLYSTILNYIDKLYCFSMSLTDINVRVDVFEKNINRYKWSLK